jgi:hypothetical protein
MYVKPAGHQNAPGMWEAVQAAVTEGWAATARLCLFVLVRYGPRSGAAVVAVKVADVIIRGQGT